MQILCSQVQLRIVLPYVVYMPVYIRSEIGIVCAYNNVFGIGVFKRARLLHVSNLQRLPPFFFLNHVSERRLAKCQDMLLCDLSLNEPILEAPMTNTDISYIYTIEMKMLFAEYIFELCAAFGFNDRRLASN